MDRRYLRSSSLARKFFDDFPDASHMPLEFMGPGQHYAYAQHVAPLMDFFNRSPSLTSCCGVVKQLADTMQKDFTVYEQSRAAAEYIQSPFAVCMLDAAGSCSAQPQAAAFYKDLLKSNLIALDELLYEDIRRRFIANGLQDITQSLTVRLYQHPAVASATPHPKNLDRLLLSPAATCSSCSNNSSNAATGGNLSALAAGIESASSQLEANSISREAAAHAPAGDTAAAAPAGEAAAGDGINAPAAEPASILKRAAWRQQLARLSSHYLAAILGQDGPGTVVLTGSSIARILTGTQVSELATEDAVDERLNAAAATGASSSPGSTILNIAFVGYPDAAASQRALDGCLKELLTRWCMRHPTPLADHWGRPLLPLAVATQHHLLLILPEPTGPLPPAAVRLDAAALAAAVDNGALQGPAAAAAAAATGGDVVVHQQVLYRDVMFNFDLTLHPSMEALLLSAAVAGDLVLEAAEESTAAAGNSSKAPGASQNAPAILLAAANAMNAFAYDGDDVFALPSAVRVLVNGMTLVNPTAVMAVESFRSATPHADRTDQSAATTATLTPTKQKLPISQFMGKPGLLRNILDHKEYDALGAAGAATASMQPYRGAAAAGCFFDNAGRDAWVQQLSQEHGWTWGRVHRQSATAANIARSDQQQQQQLYQMPAHVSRSVAGGWWKGPVMHGSVLYGSVVSGII